MQPDVSRETIEKLKAYEALLRKWQKAINLVSDASLENLWERHFEDSLQLLSVIPSEAEGSQKDPSTTGLQPFAQDDDRVRVADFGSGAGFPGLVLAIARPDLDVHLIESDQRKCEFLKNVSRETNTKVTIHNARIETIIESIRPGIITARAFADITAILDAAKPCLQHNPVFILLKGKNAENELTKAQKTYNFALEAQPSATDPGGQIVILKNVRTITS